MQISYFYSNCRICAEDGDDIRVIAFPDLNQCKEYITRFDLALLMEATNYFDCLCSRVVFLLGSILWIETY